MALRVNLRACEGINRRLKPTKVSMIAVTLTARNRYNQPISRGSPRTFKILIILLVMAVSEVHGGPV